MFPFSFESPDPKRPSPHTGTKYLPSLIRQEEFSLYHTSLFEQSKADIRRCLTNPLWRCCDVVPQESSESIFCDHFLHYQMLWHSFLPFRIIHLAALCAATLCGPKMCMGERVRVRKHVSDDEPAHTEGVRLPKTLAFTKLRVVECPCFFHLFVASSSSLCERLYLAENLLHTRSDPFIPMF